MHRDGGPGWRNVAYVSGTTGWLIHGNLGAITASRLMNTINVAAGLRRR